MTVTVRTALASDVAYCVAILRDWAEETSWMAELDEREPMEAFWREVFERDRAWVAESEHGIVGFCVRQDGGENNIGALYVAARARGGGIGKRLLDMAKANCGHITVWAYEANDRARRFYAREGLVEVSREFDDDVQLMDVEHHWAAPSSR